MELKKLAITGANGYLGKQAIKIAIQKGWSVIGIVRRDEAVKEVESIGANAVILENFTPKSLKNALIGCKAVLHFRGVVCGSNELFEKINVDGMRVLAKAAAEANVSRIIFPSGLGVDRYEKEEWANNAYFYSKNAAEKILAQGKVPFIIFRPSYILGPNDELVPEIINQIYDGIVKVAGKGNIPMQPIYIVDAVNAFLAAADGEGPSNNIYDLVGPETVTMIDLIELVFKNLVNLGFNLPRPRISFIKYEDAAKAFGICKEMVDVMRCDLLSNGDITSKTLNFRLSDLNNAIKAAITEKLFPKTIVEGKKAIILLSGGIDSATALYWAYHEGFNLIAISFNYDFRPEKEKQASLKLCENLGVKLIEIPMKYMKESIQLRMEGFSVPTAIDAPEGFIPSRNLIFYSIASYFADVYGCEYIIGGHISPDPNKFPDASPKFFKSLENLINKGKHERDKSPMQLIFPLEKKKKIDVVRLAKDLNVPLKWTWSCYSDEDQPCGRCSSCRIRKKAFIDLGFTDQHFSL
jgi:7-cyano-7-deazaguanine synthase